MSKSNAAPFAEHPEFDALMADPRWRPSTWEQQPADPGRWALNIPAVLAPVGDDTDEPDDEPSTQILPKVPAEAGDPR